MPKRVLNPFKQAQGDRVRIVNEQKREIKKAYQEACDELRKQIRWLEGKNDVSSTVRRRYLDNLLKDAEKGMQSVDKKTERIVRGNMDKMVSKVMQNNQMFINGLGFQGYINDPALKTNAINRILSGKLYGGKWTLSSAIWGDNKQKVAEMNKIIAKGIMLNKGTYDIAKDLERYVNPSARKDFEWSKMFPGSRRKIDYNAQRLARTMVSHAYQESFVAMTKNNPFIEGYKWITSGSDRVCPICIDRAETDHYGLGEGIFPKDALPLDHPNGMCTFEVVMTMSEKEISEALADWYLGEGDPDMNEKINKFVKDLNKY